jgi:squalene-associated FAD-dependent desaturase
MARTVHIIGAGLSGLSAAVRLTQAGVSVVVHEATAQAGGRCRSYYDHALGATIDNGNHLLLSGNHAAMSYLRLIGGEQALTGPARAEFPFIDLATGERWIIRPNEGRLPAWIFSSSRRVPGTRMRDYLSIGRLLRAPPNASIGSVMNCSGVVYERLWRPFLLAALNTEPPEAASGLAAALVRETLMAGGRAYRPLIARDGLSAALVDPALHYLAAHNAPVRFEHNLRALNVAGGRAFELDFGGETVQLGPQDAVVLAVPPWMAKTLLPGLETPDEFRAIVNAHFRIAPPKDFPLMIGVVNGTVEWIFAFPERLSVTISAGDRLVSTPREQLAQTIWREVAQVAGVAEALPPWQIVRERRATFAALPEQNAKRPETRTAWENLVLAGDWTATGLPATIEGAVRSGERAAEALGVRVDR